MKSSRKKYFRTGGDIKQALEEANSEDSKFWGDLFNESDRGVTLGAGAYFDAVLERCLGCYFGECDAAEDLLSPQGGLGTFAARAKCARALRIIDEAELRQLKLLAKIRNEFAHSLMATFDDQKISAAVETFWVSFGDDVAENFGTRNRFNVSCLALSLALQRREWDVAMHVADYDEHLPQTLTAAHKLRVMAREEAENTAP